jgi:hypothetical protein
MKRRILAIAVATFVLPWDLSALDSPRHIFTFHFSVQQQQYSLHVVVPHFLTQNKNDLDDFVSDFLKASPRGNVSRIWQRTDIAAFLQNWVIQHYRDIGLLPKDTNSVLSQALNRTSYFDIMRSGAAFVTPRNSKEVLALVRIDADTENETSLGIEKFMLERGMKSAPFGRMNADQYVARKEKNDFRLIHLPDGQFQFGMVRQTGLETEYLTQRPPGAAAELLNFNKVEGVPDFLPLLYLTIDAFGLTRWSGKLASIGMGARELVGIDNYYMHCEGEARRKYFEKSGWNYLDTYENPHFKTKRGDPIPNYVLTIDRAGFKSSLERFFVRRDSFIQMMLAHFELDASLRNQVRCQRILAAHSEYPVRLGPQPRANFGSAYGQVPQ